MGRESVEMKNIMTMYGISEKERDDIIKRTKSILKIVRGVYWATKNKADNLKAEAIGKLALDMDSCLRYLSDFAPIREQQDFETNVLDLYQNKFMIQPFEKALQKIKSYPELDEQYHNILYKSYFDPKNLPQDIIARELNMDVSNYYVRKKEAILLFAFSFVNIVIKKLKSQKARNHRKNKTRHNQ